MNNRRLKMGYLLRHCYTVDMSKTIPSLHAESMSTDNTTVVYNWIAVEQVKYSI